LVSHVRCADDTPATPACIIDAISAGVTAAALVDLGALDAGLVAVPVPLVGCPLELHADTSAAAPSTAVPAIHFFIPVPPKVSPPFADAIDGSPARDK
jgi:hypothetical protein